MQQEKGLDKCFEVSDLVDQSQLYSDKTHSMNRSEVIKHVKSGEKRPQPTRKVLKTLVDRPATNWNEFFKNIDLNGIDKEALIIGLKEKERELNEVGRFFAMMSRELREYFVITEFLIKQHFVPYFSGLTMADDLTEFQKRCSMQLLVREAPTMATSASVTTPITKNGTTINDTMRRIPCLKSWTNS